ncbi:MAG TPA: phosphate-starvation-inducible PsiE family protein [Rhodocyclaceae bacterium]|nr:phosphate-starvation-inducible PsiE family protein [Rhodocyclaceae bacterium]
MINTFETTLVKALKKFNQFLHVLLSLALVIASLMVMWEFSIAVIHSVYQGNLAHGFLQALGTLFIVWTLSSLITAEINYVQSGVFHLIVFIEVSIITLLRQLIVEPVQVATSNGQLDSFNITHYALVLAALLVVGILHKIVSSSDNDKRA